MGLRFRKSIKLGPVRVNLSKSGIGYSVGTKGYRVTKRADGKVQTTASIPGTGISYVDTIGSSKKSTAKKPAASAAAASVEHVSTPTVTDDGRKVYSVQTQQRTPKRGNGAKGWIAGALAAVVLGVGTAALTGKNETPADKGTLPPQVATQVTPEISTEPESPAISEQAPAAPEAAPDPTPTPEPEPEDKPEVTPSAPAVVPVVPVVTPEPEQPAQSEPQAAKVIGNSNTKKYHDPGCSSVDEISEQNYVVIASADEAEAKGYVACKRCGG